VTLERPELQKVLQRACFIKLSAGAWIGTKKLKKDLMAAVGDQDWLRGVKDLVDQIYLKPPRRVIDRTQKYLESDALPCPIESLTLVNRDSIERIDLRLKEFETEFWREVDLVESTYEEAKRAARLILEPDGLWDPMHYPPDIRKKYRFEWQYFALDTPARSQILTPEVYAREREKFTNLMEETQQLAVLTLRSELQGLVSHMVDRLQPDEEGAPKKFKDSLVGNFYRFFEIFEERNLFKDAELESLVAEAKLALQGITPDSLRDAQTVRTAIRIKMETMKDRVDQAVVAVTRQLIFDDEKEAA
jgi:hypothetical protein